VREFPLRAKMGERADPENLLTYHQRRLVIDTRCRELANDLEQVIWKADPNGNMLSDLNKSDPMRTHLSDALGYMVRAGVRHARTLRREGWACSVATSGVGRLLMISQSSGRRI